MRPLRPVNPTHLGRYRLLGVLGDGGMARVYLGQSPSGRRLAIKVVRPEFARDPAFRRRFAREVEAARAVSPLFTAAVVDADTEAESPWLATTYIEGPTLDQLVAEHGPLAVEAVLTLAAGLAEALASIHRTGLVHRDLKPSNVIINDVGPHVIDFGVALLSDASYATTSLVLGTPSYMAPERLDGGEVGAPGDIFALGATLVRACTGRNLVNAGTVYEQLFQITNGRFDLSAVPRRLRPLIMHCLSHRPKDRPTAEELVRTLVDTGARPPSPGWYSVPADPLPTETDEPEAAPPAADGRSLPSRPGPLSVSRQSLRALAPSLLAPSLLAGRPATALPSEPATPSQPSLGTHQTPRLSRRRVLAFGGMAGAALAVGGVSAARGMFERLGGGAHGGTGARTARPGAVLWQARSGVRPDPHEHGSLILVDRDRIITADESQLRAVSVTGRTLWRLAMPAEVVELQFWAGGVLAADAARVWLLNPATGASRFQVDLSEPARSPAPSAQPDGVAGQIVGVATADLAFVNLGDTTVALDRTGQPRWRSPRPAPADGRRPTYARPDAASARWVATKDPTGAGVQVRLLDAGTGRQSWSTGYPVAPQQQQPPPPGPEPSGPPPGSGPGGPPPRPGPGGPPPDDAWYHGDARLADSHLALRDGSDITVLRLADGGTAWHRTSPRPIAAVELTGEVLLVGADQLYAYSVSTGAPLWQAPLRGARVAGSAGGGVIAVTEESIASFDLQGGAQRWEATLPDSVRGCQPDRLTVIDRTAFVTFKAADGRPDPLDADVVAIALDDGP